jgi:hypothetical protein
MALISERYKYFRKLLIKKCNSYHKYILNLCQINISKDLLKAKLRLITVEKIMFKEQRKIQLQKENTN